MGLMKVIPWLVVAIFAVVLLRVAGQFSAAPTSKSPTSDPDKGARGACMLFVKRSLKDPDSADWGDTSAWTVTHNTDGTISVGARYSARNGYGATAQAYTTCVMRKTGEGFDLVTLAPMH